MKLRTLRVSCAAFACFSLASTAFAQGKPTVDQALGLRPIQTEIDYDQPSAEEAKKCTLNVEPTGGHTGWIVRDGEGKLLRRFMDSNKDNKVDLWCYYKDGVEVYRDIDANFNGKADQYRWLGTAGTRWGLDVDENGQIDVWKIISAEELSAEMVAAIRDRDAQRFARTLITAEELNTLGLGADHAGEIRKRIAKARDQFVSMARAQKSIDAQTKWIHFGATKPGLIPAGTAGSTKDLTVYENVVAVVQNDGKAGQVPIGTLVKVGDTWRAIDVPAEAGDDAVAALGNGFFFASSRFAGDTPPTTETVSESGWQQYIKQLEAVDSQLLKAASPAEQAKLNAQRADVIEKLIEALPEDEQGTWIRQLADTISAAVQSGEYPQGSQRLEDFYNRIAASSNDDALKGYVKFRAISADYGRRLRESMNDPKADVAKIQDEWLKKLSDFVKVHPKATDAPEAMLQLAIAQEFAGNDTDAEMWYGRIINEFPQDARAKKAAGAKRRLDSVGNVLEMRGPTLSGHTFDMANYKGKVVVIHYWATWCEPCKQDLVTLDKLLRTYQAKGFEVVGIGLDHDKMALVNFVKQSRIAWPQMFEEGGLDSRLANELGVLTLPTMLLIGKDGKVLNRAIHAGQLEAELKELLK